MQISENKRKTQKIPIYFNKRIPPIKCMQIKVRRLSVPCSGEPGIFGIHTPVTFRHEEYVNCF